MKNKLKAYYVEDFYEGRGEIVFGRLNAEARRLRSNIKEALRDEEPMILECPANPVIVPKDTNT